MGIKNYDYFSKCDEPIALALGYFDSLHYGHLKLIDAVKASKFAPYIFTFTNNPAQLIRGERGQIFTFDERLTRLEQLGIEGVISATFDDNFMNIEGQDFLLNLIERFNIKLVVAGKDYTCGVGGKLKADGLVNVLRDKNIPIQIIDLFGIDGEKYSSTKARELIARGDIENLNQMLPIPYSISGAVVGGRRDGGKILGYPTANIMFSRDKLYLKEGVYYTKIKIGETSYAALTNVGNHPTFDDFNYNVESFILDFDGNIYDEILEVIFVKRIRDTIKFPTIEMLKEQITKDVRQVREWLR